MTWVSITVCWAVSGCAGSLFKSHATPTAVYVLSPTATATASASASATAAAASPTADTVPADLAILKPRVRAGLNSDRVAVSYPDRRLDFLAGARWSGPLDDVVQDLTVQAFHTPHRWRSVTADSSAFASGYWLEVVVVDFQAEYTSAAAAPTVRVRFFASLGTATDRRVLGRFDITTQQAASENHLTAIIDAYEVATNAALSQLVTQATAALADASIAH